MNTFIACGTSKFSAQLLEAEKKFIYFVHLKAFLSKLDNILWSKYKNMLCLADIRIYFVVF
jgi:hypothetical protein